MRRIVLASIVLALASTVGVARAATTPTAAQIARAVRTAERSPDLWATVNICDTRRYPHTVGVRGQMPALGFGADLRMTFEIDYYSQPQQAFVRLGGVADPIDLGTESRGSFQTGARFTFRPRAGLVRGRVVFAWRRNGRTIGRVVRLTSGGHQGVRFGDPRGYSRDTCVIV